MELTAKQEEGLKIAIQRYKEGARYTTISGYAGSGKSTLIKFIIAALSMHGVDPETEVIFTAFTGKACNVMQKMGNKNVSTLHRLLYEHRPLPNGKFLRIPVPIGALPYKVVIVDEVSMVPMDLMRQLAKHPLYIICCGDPFQLPPVDPDADNHLLDTPHVFLDQIMRQAAESEIIRLSMDIREGRSIKYNSGKEVIVMPKDTMNTAHLQWADQIICGTNAMRVGINNQMRDLLLHQGGPQDGDKVICLRNYWDIISNNGEPLVNGTIGYLKNVWEHSYTLPRYLCGGKTIEYVAADFISDSNEEYTDLNMDKQNILTGQPTLDHKQKFVVGKKYPWAIPQEFTYGYAITCHKSQGSQWDKVLVVEEKFPFAKEEHARWLYTACTRAAEKLVLVR